MLMSGTGLTFQPVTSTNQLRGFYLDLYARENKRGGAWMDGHREARCAKLTVLCKTGCASYVS